MLFASLAPLSAADTIVVVSAETLVPIRDVRVYLDHKASVATNYEGKFLLFHKDFKELHLRHPSFLERVLYPEEIKGDTVRLLPNSKMLSEVIVDGRILPKKFNVLTPTDAQLLSARPDIGIDLMSVVKSVAKLMGYRSKTEERHRKALKSLENY